VWRSRPNRAFPKVAATWIFGIVFTGYFGVKGVFRGK
jgi:hypothetical protein